MNRKSQEIKIYEKPNKNSVFENSNTLNEKKKYYWIYLITVWTLQKKRQNTRTYPYTQIQRKRQRDREKRLESKIESHLKKKKSHWHLGQYQGGSHTYIKLWSQKQMWENGEKIFEELIFENFPSLMKTV